MYSQWTFLVMFSNAKNSCYVIFDWLYIFPEPVKFRVTSLPHLTSLGERSFDFFLVYSG